MRMTTNQFCAISSRPAHAMADQCPRMALFSNMQATSRQQASNTFAFRFRHDLVPPLRALLYSSHLRA